MNAFTKIALTLATVGSCVAASAQSYDSQSDQERRARNRDEAVAAWERQHNGRSEVAYTDHDTHHASMREKTHEEASKTRSFTHRQLDKMRHFGERQDAKFHAPDHPVKEDDKRSTAMGSNH
ncbi:MAG TPA: hypothetical protein VMU47_03350 [Caldimonas sp.]|nr:hypothetical protein [Caldimonas sp.]